jgi:hypothetical protein
MPGVAELRPRSLRGMCADPMSFLSHYEHCADIAISGSGVDDQVRRPLRFIQFSPMWKSSIEI